MAIDFPNTPSVNQLFSVGSRTWQWNGTAWVAASSAAYGITGHGWTSGDYYTYPLTVTSSANYGTVNRTNYTPIYIAESATFDRIQCRTGSSFSGTATVRLGIYNNSGFKPTTVLLDAGTVSCTASNSPYEITINVTLGVGWYWLAWNCQSLATTNNFVMTGSNIMAFDISPVNSTGTRFGTYTESGVTGAFATAGTLGADTNPPLVYLRKS